MCVCVQLLDLFAPRSVGSGDHRGETFVRVKVRAQGQLFVFRLRVSVGVKRASGLWFKFGLGSGSGLELGLWSALWSGFRDRFWG